MPRNRGRPGESAVGPDDPRAGHRDLCAVWPFGALDGDTGEGLWSARLDHVVAGSPISFAAGDARYVAVTAGGGNSAEIAVAKPTPEIETEEAGATQ